MNTPSKQKNYALITGATSGIGYELAKLCAADGYKLILVGRSQDRLAAIAAEFKKSNNTDVQIIVKDLFVPGAAKDIYTTTKGKTIDVLINGAGQGQWGLFTAVELDRMIDIIHLDVIALTSLTRYFLKDMVTRGEGKVLNIASSVSKAPSPLLSVYAASKAFVLSLSEALIDELKDTGVTLTALQPDATDTDFFFKAQAEESETYKNRSLYDPAFVAKAGYEGMLAGEPTVVPGIVNKVLGAMNTVLPDSMIAANMHVQMQHDAGAGGRKEITHKPSAAVRESINKKTGARNGDYKGHSGHMHEAEGVSHGKANR